MYQQGVSASLQLHTTFVFIFRMGAVYSISHPRLLNLALISQRKWAGNFGGRAYLRQRRYSNSGAFGQWGWCSRYCGKVRKAATFTTFSHFVPFVQVHDGHRFDFQELQSAVIFL